MWGLLVQETKTLFKSPASISILVIPLVLLVGLGYLLPSGWIVPSSITIGIVGAVLLYFGGSIEEIKRTSFMKSISLTRLSKFSFLATKILFSVFVSMIAVLWVLLFSWIFTTVPGINFLATDFSHLLPYDDEGSAMNLVRILPFHIQWQEVQWAKMLYAGVITIVIAVSLSFVFVAFAKSSLSFYLMSFGYLLAMILFGGVVMPSFLISGDNDWFKSLYYFVPNFYTNNVMAEAFSGGMANSLVDSVTNDILPSIVNSDLIGILTINLDPNLVAHATEQDVNNITTLLTQGSHGFGSKLKPWNYSMVDLDAWYNGVNTAGQGSALIDNVYDVLSTPTQHGFDSWDAYVGYTTANLIDNLNGALGLGIPQLVGTALPDWLSLFGVGDTMDEFVGTLLVSGVAPNVLSKIFDSLPSLSGVSGIINALNGGVGRIINNSVSMTWDSSANGAIYVGNKLGHILSLAGSVVGFILPSIMHILPDILPQGIVDTVSPMLDSAATYDFIIPWIETGAFLGISITFFKWS